MLFKWDASARPSAATRIPRLLIRRHENTALHQRRGRAKDRQTRTSSSTPPLPFPSLLSRPPCFCVRASSLKRGRPQTEGERDGGRATRGGTLLSQSNKKKIVPLTAIGRVHPSIFSVLPPEACADARLSKTGHNQLGKTRGGRPQRRLLPLPRRLRLHRAHGDACPPSAHTRRYHTRNKNKKKQTDRLTRL